MVQSAIHIENLGKRYELGTRERAGRTFRETLVDLAASPFRRLRRLSGAASDENQFWALRRVGFDVAPGEVVGVIGRNGAGKSTLLKILSRITDPTEGRATIRGRVSSLLEVGTGFHPELTGRENVYLNGAILGMRKREISRKFDEILAFAGVERFLDTPIKRYSSGMTVRLAFAVAAHLESEILIIDEVLAVGDQQFQTKCLAKMNDVAHSGRTVLFVSHNMPAVERLCQRGVLLADGVVVADGPAREVVQKYLEQFDREVLEYQPKREASNQSARLTRIRMCDERGQTLENLTTGDVPRLEIECHVPNDRSDLKLAFVLHDSHQNAIFASSPVDVDVPHPTERGRYVYLAEFPGAILRGQRYSVTVSLYSNTMDDSDICWHALRFDVLQVASPENHGEQKRMGVLHLPCRWQVERSER